MLTQWAITAPYRDDNALTKLLAQWGKTVSDFTIFPDRAAWKQREEVTKAVAAILTGAQ